MYKASSSREGVAAQVMKYPGLRAAVSVVGVVPVRGARPPGRGRRCGGLTAGEAGTWWPEDTLGAGSIAG